LLRHDTRGDLISGLWVCAGGLEGLRPEGGVERGPL
jgi:hypothetical protein